MKFITILAGACIGIAAVASAQANQVETKVVTVDGEVVRYEPGNVIVIRGADNKEVRYTLLPSVAVPAEVVGRRVTLHTEPGVGGAITVTRIVTSSVTPDGKVKRTTEETRTSDSGATTRTTTTDISGRVEAYESGKTLTIVSSDGSKVTYRINGQSQVPADLAIGKTVTILIGGGPSEPVAQTVTYTIEK